MGFNRFFLKILLLLCANVMLGQEIDLFQQFSGRYDYLAFGNTLNTEENSTGSACEILTASSAEFTLQPDQTIIAAYLYWAGSGLGDFDVSLNGTPIASQRDFSYFFISTTGVQFDYFAAFADVTAQLTASGNGTYTLSDLDLLADIQMFCGANGGNATNFGGWAVTVVYEDDILPLNQVNVFDGFESVSGTNPTLEILLNSLEVVDNSEAKIGFLSWEGDRLIANNETLRLNGTILSNEPLNPPDNAFNGTNTFTNSDMLYNMDIDVYGVQNLIQPGDETALIELTSNQDLVIINNIITVLNTALPDATITMDMIFGGEICDNREIDIDYTVYNTDGTDRLPPANIGFYADNVLIGQSMTTDFIQIGALETGSITINVPVNVPADFLLRAFVDDIQAINELDDDNNEDNAPFYLMVSPDISGVTDLEQCDIVGTELFNLTDATASIDPINTISYHLTEDDANNDVNPIPNPETYENVENPQTIWIRVINPDCFVLSSFDIEILICPLPDATIEITNNLNACRQRDFTIDYLVRNEEGTAVLPAATPIAFYLDGVLVGQALTQNIIPIGGSEPGSIVIMLSEDVPDTFTLLLVVDDTGTGLGLVDELNESNNEFETVVEFGSIPPIPMLPDLLECDLGNDTAFFDLTEQDDLIAMSQTDVISYFTNFDDAVANINAIADPEMYQNGADPQTIYVRQENEICFTTTSFLLITKNCEPTIFEGMSPNNDGSNDDFIIEGLIDIFENFNLKMYTRNGNLIYEGVNTDGLWDGIPNTGLLFKDSIVPAGTYYYVLQLNDVDFPQPFLGFIYVNY
ncbi:MAG: gliding motility-associated-like protein [Candidatus Latescibacterota bacterium]|jgi:gliding motility-associated-like protein